METAATPEPADPATAERDDLSTLKACLLAQIATDVATARGRDPEPYAHSYASREICGVLHTNDVDDLFSIWIYDQINDEVGLAALRLLGHSNWQLFGARPVDPEKWHWGEEQWAALHRAAEVEQAIADWIDKKVEVLGWSFELDQRGVLHAIANNCEPVLALIPVILVRRGRYSFPVCLQISLGCSTPRDPD